MLVPRPLLRGSITYSAAQDKETNILQQLTYVVQKATFYSHLNDRRRQIGSLVAYHLGLRDEQCRVSAVEDWVHGSFNICVPVSVDGENDRGRRRVLIRFPLPYKLGESFRPGNSDEKIRCEAATFIWLSDTCPDVPIPRLWGFGLSTGQTVWTSHPN